MSTLSGGLAWAVPVRPDLLGQSLEAYKRIRPALMALRLCHKFGQGPNVHVTKLPAEILQAVEDIIFEQNLKWYPFMEPFKHFESRCEPVDHLEDGYCDIFYEVGLEMGHALCEKCYAELEENLYCSKDCTADCHRKVESRMNEGMGGNWEFECCEPECDMWETLIEQDENGNFVQYDKILREYFGLEAYFGTTRVNDKNRAAWPEHPNHKWREDKELQTTICYLTLPKTMSHETSYEPSEMENEVGPNIQGSDSYLVELPSLHDKKKRDAQFKTALRVLRLKPYLHPSQLNSKISATSSAKDTPKAKSNKGDGKKANVKAREAADMEWPQLIMLSKTSYMSDW